MKNKNIFWGMFFVAAAALIVVNQMGYFASVNMFGVVLSVFLGCIMISNIVKLSWPGILFPAAFLCIIYAEPLGIEAITPWTVLLAALLGSIGLSMIFRKKPRWQEKHPEMKWAENTSSVSGEHIYIKNRFGSSTKYVKSQDFSKAELFCSFGESSIYFDEVQIQGETAEIFVDSSFGETTIYLPKEWHVINNIHFSFADVKEMGNCAHEGIPKVMLSGSASFGDVKIVYI